MEAQSTSKLLAYTELQDIGNRCAYRRALSLAQRARCAAAIRRRPAAEIVRVGVCLPALPFPPVVRPVILAHLAR